MSEQIENNLLSLMRQASNLELTERGRKERFGSQSDVVVQPGQVWRARWRGVTQLIAIVAVEGAMSCVAVPCAVAGVSDLLGTASAAVEVLAPPFSRGLLAWPRASPVRASALLKRASPSSLAALLSIPLGDAMNLKQDRRRLSTAEALALSENLALPLEQLLNVGPQLELELVAEVSQPRWRSAWVKEGLDDAEALMMLATDAYALAARDAGPKVNWRARISASIAQRNAANGNAS